MRAHMSFYPYLACVLHCILYSLPVHSAKQVENEKKNEYENDTHIVCALQTKNRILLLDCSMFKIAHETI